MSGAVRKPAIGCCLTAGSFMREIGSANAPEPERDAAETLWQGIAETLGMGYDFVELTVGSLTGLTEPEFDRLLGKLAGANIGIPVLNSFIPPSMKITGFAVDEPALAKYVNLAMERSRAAGCEIIVFGSGGARRIPDGFPEDQGLKQIERFLSMCSDRAAAHGLDIAIEPLNRGECNVLNTVERTLRMAESLKLPHIRVLADAYHMHLEREPLEAVARAAASSLLAHVHYAESDRGLPLEVIEGGVRLEALLETLRAADYAGRISAECLSSSAPADRARSLQFVHACWNRITTRGAN